MVIRSSLTPERTTTDATMNIGTNLSNQQKIELSTDTIRRHVYIIGKSGAGKSVLLEQNILHLIEKNWGVCLIDPHGDLAEVVGDKIPHKRLKEIIYFDPADPNNTIGFNPIKDIHKDNRAKVAEQLFTVLQQALPRNAKRSFYDGLEESMLLNSLLLLLDSEQVSLMDLRRVIVNDDFRASLLKHADKEVQSYWKEEFGSWGKKQDEYTAGYLNKLRILTANPAVRKVLGGDGLDLAWVMNQGKVLICNFSKGRLGDTPSKLLGSLFTSHILQVAQDRANIPEEERKDFALVVDEFQTFTNPAFSSILSEARKYRLALILAHQFMSQLPDYLQDAVIGTANTTIAFRCGAKDARLIADELDLDNYRRVKNLPNYHALIRTVEGGMPGNTHEVVTDPPRPSGGRLEAVRERTRLMYGSTERLLG